MLSLRYLLYLFSWLCMWQGWHVSGSIFQLDSIGWIIPGLYMHESFLVYTIALLFIERILSGDFYFARSYFSGPILLTGFALVFSWIYGMYLRQEFTYVYEAHESILIVLSFFVVINIFRNPEERKVLLVLFFLATIMKAADSTWIKFFSTDDQKGWGTLLFWRDGFLLAMGISGTLILAHYRGKELRWLRKLMLWISPFIMYGLIISFRRTFIIALLVSAVAMIVTIGRGRRKKQFGLLLFMIFGALVFVLVTDPIGIIARLVGGVFQPKEEGSSYIRLMEYPNILQNIYHHPIFGVPIGTQWFQYYRMPMFANFTTFGCHNTYLYWPLRTGLIGSFAFLWFLARTWKAIIINIVVQKTEEDFLINQFLLHCMIVYNFASFLGLMYADAMGIMTAFILVMLQLQIMHTSGVVSYKNINLLQTVLQRKLVVRKKDKLIRRPIMAS